MAHNVFISFRYSDGHIYKDRLSQLFSNFYDTVDFSEDQNRSYLSEASIQKYLYNKLRRSSVTIILLTPQAVNHKKDFYGRYDDWMYDEIRYSLEDRENNRTNGLIAVYTEETEKMVIEHSYDGNSILRDVDNLYRKNMLNIKPYYKHNPNDGIYDSNYDSYCSLVSYTNFVSNVGKYIDIAIEKRDKQYQYEIHKRLYSFSHRNS